MIKEYVYWAENQDFYRSIPLISNNQWTMKISIIISLFYV